MKNLTLLLLCFFWQCQMLHSNNLVPEVNCQITATSSQGVVNISGLTGMDNAKLFNQAVTATAWSCDPWNGTPCNNMETISGLTIGATYYLSVQSDQCDEWIPIVVEGGGTTATCTDGIQNQGETGIDCGGPCTPCQNPANCDANIVVNGTSASITGLTAAENAKLFDANYASVWDCNPWNGMPCTDNATVDNLTPGATYFFSAQSDLCDVWIPITIDEDATGEPCEVTLENYSGNCIHPNADGSFSIRFSDGNDEYTEQIYDADGNLTTILNIVLDPPTTFSIVDNSIAEIDEAGVVINSIGIDPQLVATYTTGNNHLLPTVEQGNNGEFYMIGRVVDANVPIPPTSGQIASTIFDELFVYHLDADGNEIKNLQFDVLEFPGFGYGDPLENQIVNIGIIPRIDGGVDIMLEQSLELGPLNTYLTANHFFYQIDSEFQTVNKVDWGNSNSSSLWLTNNVVTNSVCGLVEIQRLKDTGNPNGGFTENRFEHWDYSVSPSTLLYTTIYFRDKGQSGHQIYGLEVPFSDGFVAIANEVVDHGGSLIEPISLTIEDQNGNIVSETEIAGLPSAIFQNANGTYNYIVGNTLYLSDCDDTPEPVVCNVSMIAQGNSVTITGLPADANTKLFDASYSAAFECSPWNGNPCTDNVTIDNLTVGATYFLSVQSDLCDEWIPITIQGSGPNQACEVELENFTLECFLVNEDGTFSSTQSAGNGAFVETIYDGTGNVIALNDLVITSSFSISNNMIAEHDALGNLINTISIDPAVMAIYTTGNNYLLSNIEQDSNGEFYIVGRVVDTAVPVPPSSGTIPESINDEMYLHHLDVNGNEIKSILFGTLELTNHDFENPLLVPVKVGLAPRADGGVDMVLEKNLQIGTNNTFYTKKVFSYEIDPTFQSVSQEIVGASDVTGDVLNVTIEKDQVCGYYKFENLYTDFGSAGGLIDNRYEYWNYNTTPPQLLYTEIFHSTLAGQSNSLEVTFSNGNVASAYDLDPSWDDPNDLPPTLEVTDANGNVIYSEEIAAVPNAIIPNSDGTYSYIIGSTLYVGNCENLSQHDNGMERISSDVINKLSLNNIFPNPTSGETFLRIESTTDQEIQLNIYDMVGKLQLTQKVDVEIGINTLELNLNDLHSGIYNLILQDQDQNIQNMRFVKN